jgi:hypothetical protein
VKIGVFGAEVRAVSVVRGYSFIRAFSLSKVLPPGDQQRDQEEPRLAAAVCAGPVLEISNGNAGKSAVLSSAKINENLHKSDIIFHPESTFVC